MGGESSIQVRNTTILLGDVRASLRTLSAGSVHCCVTSPPYWGLRSYGTEPQIWANGWRGELGSEPTIEQFVSNIVDVFREVKRVLRDDGLCWVNLGDSYSAHPGQRGTSDKAGAKQKTARGSTAMPSRSSDSLKPKDLCGIPWRVVLALQADGWYWRDTIVWQKPAPMPESVTDRCTKSWEPIFMLAKSPKYFCDMVAVKEAGVFDPGTERRSYTSPRAAAMGREASGNESDGYAVESGFRNLRNVWTISTEPLSMPHFAAYPTALPSRCIKISTSERGVCPTCGKQWERVTSKSRRPTRPGEKTKVPGKNSRMFQDRDPAHPQEYKHDRYDLEVGNRDTKRHVTETVTTGWQPACSCGGEPVPATVLDPFLGSGSTSVAAERLGRRSIGCELNEKYAREIAVLRIQTALDDGEHKPVKPLDGQLVLL